MCLWSETTPQISSSKECPRKGTQGTCSLLSWPDIPYLDCRYLGASSPQLDDELKASAPGNQQASIGREPRYQLRSWDTADSLHAWGTD